MNLKKYDIFSPLLFVVLVIVYLIFSQIAFQLHLKELVGVNINTVYIIIAGLLAYIIGMFASSSIFKNKEFITNTNKLDNIFSERNVLSFVVLGIFLQVLNLLYLGGIPLFSGYLKAHAATRIWLLSYLIFLPSINILIAKYNNKKYYLLFLAGLILFALTGYRTTVMAIVISILINVYYTKRIPKIYIALSIFGIFLLLLAVGYIAVKSIEWQTWTLNPLELLFYRAGYTLQVLDNAVNLQGSTNGALLYNTLTGFLKSTDPRVIVGSTTLGYAHSTTSMIFGPALLDFGIHAMIIQMILIGFIMNVLYLIQKSLGNVFVALYAMLLAHVLIWIETGPTDLVVLLFFAISIIIVGYAVKIKRRESN